MQGQWECVGKKSTRFTKMHGYFLLRATLLGCLMAWGSLHLGAQDAQPYGDHFILLLDDSGDAQPIRDEIREHLEKWLFQEESKDRSHNEIPFFRPDRDYLSIATFTIYTNRPKNCGSRRKTSALPEHLFDWLNLDNHHPDKSNFESWAKEGKLFPCREKGGWSPFITSRLLALYGVAPHVQNAGPFSNTYILIYRNDLKNNYTLVSGELEDLKKNDVEDVERAKDAIRNLGAFYIVEDRGWQYKSEQVDPAQQAILDIFKVVPRKASPERAINHSLKITLDRKAISSKLLEVMPKEAKSDVLLFDKNGMNYLEPLSLRWRVVDDENSPWRFGSIKPSGNEFKKKSLQDLEYDSNGIAEVPLLSLWQERTFPASQTQAIKPGVIEFYVDFRALTPDTDRPLYDRLVVTSQKRRISMQITADPVIQRGLFFGDLTLDYAEQVRQWQSTDHNGLTTELASERILATTAVWQKVILALLVLAVIGLLSLIYKFFLSKYYHRPFKPKVAWVYQPVTLDFNNLQSTLLVAGYLSFQNKESVPAFGKFLKNEEQPSRKVTLTLELAQELADLGFELSDSHHQIGFFVGGEEASSNGLDVLCQQTIVHGTDIPIYFNPSAIQDFQTKEATISPEGVVLNLGGTLTLTWQLTARDRLKDQVVSVPLELECRLLPERALPPLVGFKPVAQPLVYQKNQQLLAGAIQLSSVAKTRFGVPFKDEYYLKAHNDHKPINGEPFLLEQPQPTVIAGNRHHEIPVYLQCDGQLVTNPRALVRDYLLEVKGPRHPDSEMGPYAVKLERDTRPGRPYLELEYLGSSYEIFWDEDESMGLRLLKSRKQEAAQEPFLDRNQITFSKVFTCNVSREKEPQPIVNITFRNTGIDGNGYCELQLQPTLEIHPDFKAYLHLKGNSASLQALLQLVDQDDAASAMCIVKEGEAAQWRTLRILPYLIDKIDEGLLPAKYCRLRLEVKVKAHYDMRAVAQESGESHTGLILIPITFEQTPGPELLCIDFGTTAIASALGREDAHDVRVIDLQNIEVSSGVSFGEDDPESHERDSKFLPSFVMCRVNETLHQQEHREHQNDSDEYFLDDGFSQTYSCPPGFHRDAPPSHRPGEPGFLMIPPSMGDLSQSPDLVITALKSWFGEGSGQIQLGKPVYLEGEPIATTVIPTRETFESALAGFAETYIKPGHYQTDQVLLTYPNTYTPHHRQEFQQAAYNALGVRLGLISKSQIILIRESDAIAFDFCNRNRKPQCEKETEEHLLVYDFGGGTLDLSLIKLKWSTEGSPIGWHALARTGVPIAGNYVDEILARLVHSLLDDVEFMADSDFEYQFPLAGSLSEGKRMVHRRAVMAFWRRLKDAKHSWDGQADFEICMGGLLDADGILRAKEKAVDELLAHVTPRGSIFLRDQQVFLSIPRVTIENFQPYADYMDFVSGRIFEGLLHKAGLKPVHIDTLLISGRGALWPGIIERLSYRFPKAKRPDLLKNPHDMKEAVVRGAIATQQMPGLFKNIQEPPEDPLALLVGERRLIFESEWGPDQPLDMRDANYFEIVQVGLPNPDPHRDLHNLNKHFYRRLVPQRFRLNRRYPDAEVFAEKVETGGTLQIVLRNNVGKPENPLSPKKRASLTVKPPWPIGRTLLPPEES